MPGWSTVSYIIKEKEDNKNWLVTNNYFRKIFVYLMAFVGLFLVLYGLRLQVWIWKVCTSCLEYYPTDICNSVSDKCQQYLARREIWISVPMVIIQGLLCYGLIKRRSGFLTPWLLVSFIVIIGGAYNFGYVSNWFYFLLWFFLFG